MKLLIFMELYVWMAFCILSFDDIRTHDYFIAFLGWCIAWGFFLVAIGHIHILYRRNAEMLREENDNILS